MLHRVTLLSLMAVAAVAIACSGDSKQVKKPGGQVTRVNGHKPGNKTNTVTKNGHTTTKNPGKTTSPGGLLPATGIACASEPCIYHGGGDAYYICLNAAAGTCYHFGRSCAPSDKCFFDATSSTYRTCSHVVEGKCQHFGAACTPKHACMYNPADTLHHTCTQVDNGRCHSYGAVCDPLQ